MAKKPSKTGLTGRGGPGRGGGRKPLLPDIAPLADRRHLAELAREHAAECIKTAVDIMQNSSSDAAKMTAVQFLADRGYGKAPQSIQVDPENPNDFGSMFAGLITAIT